MSRILPILFNTEMVRAIRGGRKTVTRRVIRQEKYLGVLSSPARKVHPEIPDKYFIERLAIPPYEEGDILYVRETWAFMPCIGCNGEYASPGSGLPCYDAQAVEYDDGDSISDGCFIYRADCETPERIIWRPSIHMPKQAARIWLKVTNVRVERLQDITDIEAEKEGAQPQNPFDYDVSKWPNREHFKEIWNSTIKKRDIEQYGWDANPWVWVIEFEECEKAEEENA